MKIRDARPDDATAMSGVLIASIAQLCRDDHRDDPKTVADWTANKTPDHVMRWIAAGPIVLLVAEDNGAVAGVAGYVPNGEIALNYVAPSHRFRGVSTALLEAMEKRLAAEGVVRGTLVATRTAEPFYRRRGWCPDGAPEIAMGMPGQPMAKSFRP